ncbi:MAG: hypothetical protein Kow0089_23700 [Desulfobulbaceae bacterium]
MRKYEIPVLAVAWYKPEQWERLLEISEDRDKLEESYEEWLEHAEKMRKQIIDQGYLPKKFLVDTEELLQWCRERDLPVNGESRSHYAAWLLRMEDEKK